MRVWGGLQESWERVHSVVLSLTLLHIGVVEQECLNTTVVGFSPHSMSTYFCCTDVCTAFYVNSLLLRD